jgi:hypothetical protein
MCRSEAFSLFSLHKRHNAECQPLSSSALRAAHTCGSLLNPTTSEAEAHSQTVEMHPDPLRGDCWQPTTVRSPLSTAPTPVPHPPTATVLWHSVLHASSQLYVRAPALMALATIFIALSFIARARAIFWRQVPRDPVRRFGRLDKALIVGRAGSRCERHGLILGRCRATQNLEADHVHPFSKGGRTAIANGQALCQRHNRLKGARIPWGWELKRLARHRALYFPTGTNTAVTRRPAVTDSATPVLSHSGTPRSTESRPAPR